MERTLHNIVLSLHTVHSLHTVFAHSSSGSNYQVLLLPLLLAIFSPPQWTAHFPAVRTAIKKAGQSKKDGVGRGLTPCPLVLSSPEWTSSPQHPVPPYTSLFYPLPSRPAQPQLCSHSQAPYLCSLTWVLSSRAVSFIPVPLCLDSKPHRESMNFPRLWGYWAGASQNLSSIVRNVACHPSTLQAALGPGLI